MYYNNFTPVTMFYVLDPQAIDKALVGILNP